MRYFLFRMKRFCGFGVGFVFFISGILKLMDPVGTGLIMKGYFEFLHLGFMDFAAKFIGFLFAAAETTIGAGLVTGVWRKAIATAAIGLQSFFTLLTLLLVIFNPQMDCGCFGEAFHLSHAETFIKNIIILALLLVYYIPSRLLGETKKKKYVSFAVVCASAAAFATYSALYIPMNDFTALRHGNVINRDFSDTEDKYEAVFIYEKDGQEESFCLENLPDTSWTFIRTETITDKAPKHAANSISIYDKNGNYADSLLSKGKVMIVSVYQNKISAKEQREIDRFLEQAFHAGFQPFLLTASVPSESAYHYFCDYKTLITLNRSNIGATYLNDGYIIRKWAKRALPAPKELAMLSEEDPTDTFIGRDAKTSLAFQGFLLYVFAVMLLL